MSWFDSFTGKQQRKDLANAKATADAALSQGYTDAQGYYTQARDSLDPYAEQGAKGFNTYLDTLGLNGADARKSAQDLYYSDPNQQSISDLVQKKLYAKYNAGGTGYSGAAGLASARAAQEAYGGWQNQLKDLGNTGIQVAGAQSDLTKGLGDLAYGYGATKAGSEINYGNAIADSRSTGINNLLKLGGIGLQAITPGKSGLNPLQSLFSMLPGSTKKTG